jgi:predicted DNA-binding transcriptional regulator
MANDRTLGGAILAGSIVGIIVYGILLYLRPLLVLEVTAFLAVVVLLGILGWIGWTMATTPPPEPITETAQPQPAAAEKKAT